MKPFEVVALKESNYLQRLRNTVPKENAIIEIRNKLAEDGFKGLSKKFIDEIEKKYDTSLQKINKNELSKILQEIISFQINEYDDFNSINFNDFKSLSELFNIKQKNYQSIIKGFSENRFVDEVNKIIQTAIETKKGIEEYEERLVNIQNSLLLSDDKAKSILDNNRIDYVKSIYKQVFECGEYNPDKEEKYDEICKLLQVIPRYDEVSNKVIKKERQLWKIENNKFVSITTEIHLSDSEECFFEGGIGWYEYRKTTSGYRYGGTSYRIKIVKGVYIRAGDINLQSKSKDELTKIDAGNLYLTNKRIIFIGNKKSTNIPLNKIVDMNLYSNGIQVIKDSGRNPFFEFDDDLDLTIFTALFAELKEK